MSQHANDPSSPLPPARVIHVDTRGAIILEEESPEVRPSEPFNLSPKFTPCCSDAR
jgi:type II pantothenate kinase